MFALSVREFSRRWTGRLTHFRHHQNVEHLEALIAEALRFCGLALENDLSKTDYWTSAPLSRRVSLLLFLVDRGVVNRVNRDGRLIFEAESDAVDWVLAQPTMIPYFVQTLEFVSAIQINQSRRV